MDLVDVTDLVPAPDATWRAGDAFLAGGTWLFSEPQVGVTRLLDVQSFGWPALVQRPDGGLEIAATCTIAELAAGPVPLFAQCADALLGSFKIRGVATVGGNVCLALAAAPMISLTAALDGVCLLIGPDGSTRTMPVVDFVLGVRATARRPGELLRSITLPAAALAARHVFRQISLTPLGRSAALVIGRVDGAVTLTVTASTPRPVQVRFDAMPSPADAVAAVDAAVAGRWYDDVPRPPPMAGRDDGPAGDRGRRGAVVSDQDFLPAARFRVPDRSRGGKT